MAGEGKGAVFLALIGNGLLTVLKFGAFIVSGSGAMMSEAIHSFADTANQSLLYLGVRRSFKPADEEFQYGYGAERYVFALLAAVGIFFLGCGVTVYHGVHSMLHPPKLQIQWTSYAVLIAAIVIEGYVLLRAIAEINRQRGETRFADFVRSTTDPTVIAVLFEDTVATIGAAVALVGISLAKYTGNPMFDAASSIIIGLLLGLLAMWLGWRNRELILGPAIPQKVQQGVRDYLMAQDCIGKIRMIRTRIVAADRFRMSAEVDYNGRYFGKGQLEWVRKTLAELDLESEDAIEKFAADFGERMMDDLGKEIDRIEKELLVRFPRLRFVDLEAD